MLAAGCRGGGREPFVTYYNGQHGLSLRYPASWRTEQAEQEGVWYRYFLGPSEGPGKKPAVSATLLAGKLNGTLEEYAQVYLAGNTLVSSRPEERPGASGKSWLFASPDGATRHALLLIEEAGRVYGLFCQGEAPPFERHYPVLEEMARSLTLERPAAYPERKLDAFGFSIRIPPSWKESRRFSGGNTLLLQFTSPPLAADKDRQTVHASLTVTVERLPPGATLDSFYEGAREKLGESFLIVRHQPWQTGYVDSMRTETSVAASNVKRFYRVEGQRGYSLAFEARDDVFHRVSGWYDVIASTFRTDAEPARP